MLHLKIIRHTLAISTTDVKTGLFQDFARQCSYINHVRWASYLFSGCQFPTVYMCQKLWKLASSRQSYCKNNQAYPLWPTLYYIRQSRRSELQTVRPRSDSAAIRETIQDSVADSLTGHTVTTVYLFLEKSVAIMLTLL